MHSRLKNVNLVSNLPPSILSRNVVLVKGFGIRFGAVRGKRCFSSYYLTISAVQFSLARSFIRVIKILFIVIRGEGFIVSMCLFRDENPISCVMVDGS